MAHKKELSEQEKVAEILKRANIAFDPAKAEAQIALNTRCKRCGRTLSSLERITYENKCDGCMKAETKEKRDKFVRKYILIAFAFVVAVVLGGYCANSGSDVWRIVGVVISGVVTCISLGYVFYSNIDKILPSLQPKYQVWIVFALSLGVAFVISLITYLFQSWVLYIVLMLAVALYVGYIAYGEFNRLKERANLLDVYARKTRDKDFVESITVAIETRAKQEEAEIAEKNEETSADGLLPEKNDNSVQNGQNPAEKDINGVVLNKNKDISAPDTQTEETSTTAAEEPKDSGDFMI